MGPVASIVARLPLDCVTASGRSCDHDEAPGVGHVLTLYVVTLSLLIAASLLTITAWLLVWARRRRATNTA